MEYRPTRHRAHPEPWQRGPHKGSGCLRGRRLDLSVPPWKGLGNTFVHLNKLPTKTVAEYPQLTREDQAKIENQVELSEKQMKTLLSVIGPRKSQPT